MVKVFNFQVNLIALFIKYKTVIKFILTFLLVYAVLIAIFIKLSLYFFVRWVLSQKKSFALRANMADHLNDVFLMIGLLVVVVAIKYGYYIVDGIVGVIIGCFILFVGYRIGRENYDHLMGRSASESLQRKIRDKILENENVIDINVLKTQFLGNKLQVEVHIGVEESLSLKKAHDLGNVVRDYLIDSVEEVSSCFVHIDPVKVRKRG